MALIIYAGAEEQEETRRPGELTSHIRNPVRIMNVYFIEDIATWWYDYPQAYYSFVFDE